MDIEELTKSQIVLLTLLVSFMTSIATGITTVALMQQTPPAIVQSVSRVIKETVAQVASSTTRTIQPAAAAVTTQVVKTVVVRDSDLVSQAVAKASQSVVRLYSHDAANPVFLGLGVIINSTGLVVTDEAALGENADATVKRADGSYARAFVTSRDDTSGIAYLQEATSTTVTTFGDSATFPTHSAILGDMAVALEGSSVSRIQGGFVTALPSAIDTGTIAVIETDIPRGGILNGTPIIDTDGRIIGLSTLVSRAVSGGSFVPSSVFTSGLSHGKVKETATPAL